jgi:hypothetical protein
MHKKNISSFKRSNTKKVKEGHVIVIFFYSAKVKDRGERIEQGE